MGKSMAGAPLPVRPSELPPEPGGGAFQATAQGAGPRLVLEPSSLAVSVLPGDGYTSVAFDWVQAAVEAVAQGRVTVAGQTGPTVAARFYATAGTALYEAWQLFDPASTSLEGAAGRMLELLERTTRLLTAHLSAPRQKALVDNVIATTAYQVLTALAPQAEPLFAETLAGHADPLGRGLDGATNLLARQLSSTILRHVAKDGATAGATAPFTPVNGHPAQVIDIAHWTPGYRVGDDPGSGLQTCLTPGWGQVRAYMPSEQLEAFLATLKEQEPFLLLEGATADLRSRTITTAAGAVAPIDRAAVGSLINPAFLAQAERVIAVSAGLTEEQKFSAEFWEDGAGTPFPPGTWMIFGQYAAEQRDLPLGEEVKLYFSLGQALQSAAVATWQKKTEEDYARPVQVIRDLSALGLVGDPDPLTGLATVTAYSRDIDGTGSIDGTTWETYQRPGGSYSPPFPEFPSGHSTFSAAAAAVLESLVGAGFGGAVSGRGVFEPASAKEVVTLHWDTWREASEAAGLSRLYGGIHFDDGNQQGLALGALIGQATVQAATQLWA